MKVLVIGAGAAGIFTAINLAEKNPDWNIDVLEKSGQLLQKVKVSGGGRCNVTNARSAPAQLVKFYPRGTKKMHAVFKRFSSDDMVAWLQSHGVDTKAEQDQRMFPVTDRSQTIIDCFLAAAKKYQVGIHAKEGVRSLAPDAGRWVVETTARTHTVDKVVFATGSSPAGWKILDQLGLELTTVVPSLFTFNIKDPRLHDLQGIAFENSQVRVAGSKLSEEGPLLITHWGLSGPAVLKLSSWGAYALNEKTYRFEVLVNFVGDLPPEQVRQQLQAYQATHPKRKVSNYALFDLPKRFWERIVNYCAIPEQTPFGELSKKQLNKLVEELSQGRYEVNGKSTFKDEFVTAGGVKLSEVDLQTFECRRFPGLYLAGEVLDIDALTGGFNFQACWSAGWLISEAM